MVDESAKRTNWHAADAKNGRNTAMFHEIANVNDGSSKTAVNQHGLWVLPFANFSLA